MMPSALLVRCSAASMLYLQISLVLSDARSDGRHVLKASMNSRLTSLSFARESRSNP